MALWPRALSTPHVALGLRLLLPPSSFTSLVGNSAWSLKAHQPSLPTSRSWVTWLPLRTPAPSPQGTTTCRCPCVLNAGQTHTVHLASPTLQPSEAETGTPSINDETEVQDIFPRLLGPVRGPHEDWSHISVSPEPLGQRFLYHPHPSPDVPTLHCGCHSCTLPPWACELLLVTVSHSLGTEPVTLAWPRGQQRIPEDVLSEQQSE